MALRAAYPFAGVVLTLVCISLPFARGITYTMREEAPVDSYIGNVSADSGLKEVVGDDEFSNLRYSILSGGSQYSHLFKISATTGVLAVSNRVDREELCPYTDTCDLQIEIAAQYESLLRKFNVKIIVQDINDNSPQFPNQFPQPFQLSESISVDFALSLDAATDLDGSRNFSVQNYSLLPDGVPFRVVHTVNAVGATQLSLVVSRKLDRETESSYGLTVWAYDGGSPPKSGSVVLTVNVVDVNDNAPEFTSDVYTQNISESTPPGTPVLTVSASDADEGDNARVVYSISSQQPVPQQQKFTIGATNGVVSVAESLKAGVHRVLVEAQDQGSPPNPPTQAVVEVIVLDTDNNPPILNLDMLSISDFEPGFVPESEKVSTAVGYLAVSDPDSGANALVTCSSRDPHFELQSLNLNEYKVIISSPLDRENQTHLNVVLVCFDGGSPKLTSTATFDVWVVDVNDNPPKFLEGHYSASVAENNGPSDGLIQVAATDADAGNNANITYRLVGDPSMFQVGSRNGMIKARGQFDYERESRYVFHVLAVDQGQPPLTATTTVTINVLDINDESPLFSAPNYTMSVTEGEGVGVHVGNVSASDPDTGPGGEVVLSILQQPGLSLPFQLSPSGVITTTATLDREHRAAYNFHIVAHDKGIQPLTSSVLVTVKVLDVNDNAPTFVFSTGNSSQQRIVLPVEAQFVVANVQAIDPDAGPNGTVAYSVVAGNASGVFRVEESTGAVVTLVDLGERQLGTYQLVVRATDRGVPTQLHADRNLTLRVALSTAEQVGPSGGEGSDDYVIIVVCIVAFTVVVSAAVVVTMCVLRKLDQDKKLKYAAACCPDGAANTSTRDGSGSLNSSNEYHQQVNAVSSGMVTKTSTTGGGLSGPGYGPHTHMADSGSLSLASQGMLGFPQQRSSDVRTSQLQLSSSHGQHGGKPLLQLDVVRRADDFHSTSSTETTTGDSGHGSDEDIANHSHDHDRPLSPSSAASYHNPPPRPLRLGGGTTSPFAKTGSRSTPDSCTSSRPVFVGGGQFRGSRNSGSRPFSSKPYNSVRFSDDFEDPLPQSARGGGGGSRGRYASNESFRDDESDLNTTTSGSFSVPPDDLYADQLNFGAYSNGRGGGATFRHDMLV